MENRYTKIDFLIIEDDYDTLNLLKIFIEDQGKIIMCSKYIFFLITKT